MHEWPRQWDEGAGPLALGVTRAKATVTTRALVEGRFSGGINGVLVGDMGERGAFLIVEWRDGRQALVSEGILRLGETSLCWRRATSFVCT